MDFSAVVLPMMKSLEHELRIRFCDKYIEYLKREYPTLEDFTTANNIYKKQAVTEIRLIEGNLCIWF